jgi:hypothetical protein
VGDTAQAFGGGADAVGIELAAQDGLIDDEPDAAPRFVFLAARFSLRLCWAFFLSVF